MKSRFDTRMLSAALALAGSLAAPGLAHAQAACTRWDITQGFYAVQGSYRIAFRLQPRQGGVEGTASYFRPGTEKSWVLFVPITSFGTDVSGRVTGTVDGDAVELTTDWGGVYVGTIDATGRIDGTTYDKRDATSSARWYSDRRMNCLARAGAPVAPAAAPPAPPLVVPTGTSDVLTPARGSKAASVFAGTPRPAPAPAPVPAPAPAASPAPVAATGSHCRSGYVRRHAGAPDRVCVTAGSRDRVAAENRTRASRVQPGGGAYGPATCRSGFVWREAFAGDLVCVTPDVRAFVRQENQLAATRVR
jgi:hypothetical protein